MKFIQGQTLGDVVKAYHARTDAKELEQLRLLNVFVNLCQTVSYAHSRGVIHRDLKPDNVMVGAYGETLVLDWGLAKVIGSPEESSDPYAQIRLSSTDDTLATMEGSIKGTPAYFAPEMAEGIVENVDQLSDVYLLGSVLYSILTGRPPRQAKKMKELLEMARTKPPDPPRQIKPGVSKPINAICMKALAHDKKERYASATALAEDVQRYLAGEPVTAYQETFTERAWRWIKKHHKAINRTAAAVLLVGTVVTAVLVVRDFQQRAEEDRRVAERLQKEDQARQQIDAFRGRAEEARFYAAKASPVTENSEFFDVSKAENTVQEALAVADRWGKDLVDLPFEDQRSKLKDEMYELLLEYAQLKTLTPGAESAQKALTILDRAASLRAATRSFHRLRAHCLKVLDKEDKGKLDAARATQANVPVTALDFYLQGEQFRHESMAPGQEPANFKDKDGKDTKKPPRARRDLLLQAMAKYREALAIDPDHYWSYFQLGAGYLGLEQAKEAVETLGACVASRKDAPWGYSSRALALMALNRYDDAHADVKKAMKLDSDSLATKYNRGLVYFHQKKYEPALADFNAVLEAPEDKRILEAAFSRGQVHMFRKDPHKARDDFDLVVKQKPNLRHVYLMRARLDLAEGKGKDCIANLTSYFTVGQAAPLEDAKLFERIARELRVLATELPREDLETQEAAYRLILSQLDKAIKKGELSPDLLFEIGAAEELLAGVLSKPRPQEAQRVGDAEADRLIKARGQEARRRMLAALTAYSKGIEIDPKHVRLLVKRGWTYVNVGRDELASPDFKAAIDVDRLHAEAHTGLGYALATQKKPVEARYHANMALLWGGGDYIVIHNTACIFAVLADNEPSLAKEYRDLLFEQLRRALERWEDGGRTEPSEIRLINEESAFRSLREHPDTMNEFKKLLETK
jgi:Tfp pilus assembly protein PilF